MNIATALNRKYILYTGVMLHSLCMNNPVSIRAFLLHSELLNEDIQLLRESLHNLDIKIIPLKVDSDLFSSRLPRNSQWSIETYYRLMLLDLLPADVDRLLYIDVDIIINKPLTEIYAIDFGEDEIIAAIDSCGKKTWGADNCHFDIEQLWWDYAKATPFYIQLLEEFLQKSMTDTTVESYINDILANNRQLQDQLNKSLELNQKLLSMIQGN